MSLNLSLRVKLELELEGELELGGELELAIELDLWRFCSFAVSHLPSGNNEQAIKTA